MDFDEDKIKFLGCLTFTSEQSQLETPYQCFKYFFNDDFMQKIVAETNLYNMQKDPNNKNIHSIGYQKVFWDIAVHVSAKVSKYQSILAPSSWLWPSFIHNVSQ